tara:strand:+ start:507 stop:764 length:258 start_codon:yes stop_codon:yes gene_type:complete
MDFLGLNSVHWDKLVLPFLLLLAFVPFVLAYRIDKKNKSYMKRQQDLAKEQTRKSKEEKIINIEKNIKDISLNIKRLNDKIDNLC